MRELTDQIEGFTIPESLFKKHTNEKHTFNCLSAGLDMLNDFVVTQEAKVRSKLPENMEVRGFNLPAYEGVNQKVVVSCFHWYANSACNLARLIGWFRCQIEPDAPNPLEYAQSLLPQVYPFRNKVSAHFARTTGPGRDNDAERHTSVISALGWNDAFEMPAGMMFRRSGGKLSDSSSLQPWSITKVHKGLIERFGLEGGKRPATSEEE